MITVARRLKQSCYRLLTALFGDNNGVAVLPVLRGPAKGLWFGVRLANGEAAFVSGTYEPSITKTIAEACNPGQIAWDCGTHIGFYTVILARRVGPHGTVIAFEPDATNCIRTERNVALNGFANVTIVQKAVGAPLGMVSFHSTGDHVSHIEGTYVGHQGAAGVGDRRDGTAIMVECISPNEAIGRLGITSPDFIKFDLEGAEAGALAHMDAVVAATRPIMLVELHNQQCEQALFSFATKYDYRLQDALSGRNLPSLPLCSHVLCTPRRSG